MAKLTIAESNELWEEYCRFMNPKKSQLTTISLIKRKRVYYDDDWVGDGWEPGEQEAMIAVRELEMVGSKQLGDW